MIKNYEDAINYIHGTYKFGVKLGLDNMHELLRLLGNPHKAMKYVHIAGTNGKGSIASFTANILEDAGYKVGKFISPYIQRFTERISINGTEIAEDELPPLCEKVRRACEDMVSRGFNHPTEFELVTAIAFLYYKENACDYAVLEVGLGGRMDSTNIIPAAEVSIIAHVALDHCEILGDTLTKIAYEKGGIIKDGARVVVEDQEAEVIREIQRICDEKHATMLISSPDDFTLPKLRLIGDFQRANAAAAYAAMQAIGIDEKHILSGLSRTVWPGRLEKLSSSPDFYIDGAHNPDAAQALVASLKSIYGPSQRYIFILGMMADKAVDEVLEIISEVAEAIICVTPDNPRAISSENLASKALRYCANVVIGDTILKAVFFSEKMAKEIGKDKNENNNVIVACGSLYYIGEVRSIKSESID